MKEEQRDAIQTAAEHFGEALQKMIGPHGRVAVFYCYLDIDENDGNTWYSGSAGNSNWCERRGALLLLQEMEALGVDRKLGQGS